VRSIEKVTTGLRWKQVAEPLLVTGEPTAADRAAATELGGTVAALL
jgi:hypothetical protein